MATTAVLNLGLNTRQFTRGLASASSKLNMFKGTTLGVVGALSAGVVAGIGAIGFSFIKASADAEETTNKFNAVFAGINGEANKTAKNLAKNFGLSARESEKLLGNTGDLLTGFGFTRQSALDLSRQVQELAGDLGSFQNVDTASASESITKALLGETESMKSLGVVVRQNTQEFRDNVAETMRNLNLTEQQAKAQVIFQQILSQSKNAVGDYAKTSKSLANQLKLTGKIFDDLKIGIGNFIREFTGFDSATLAFNSALRSMTDNLLGILANWQANWKIFKNWLSDNIVVIFTKDLPSAIATMYKNFISNTAVQIKILADLWITFQGWWVGFVTSLFSGDMNDALLKSLKKMFTSMTNWAKQVWDNLVSIFKGDSGTVFEDFAKKANKGFQAGLTGEGLFDAMGDVISEGVSKLKGPLEGFKTATEDIQFLKDLPEGVTDAGKAIGDVLGDKSIVKTDPTKSQERRTQEFSGAFEKGSVEAYKVEKSQQGNKTEKEQLKVLQKIEKKETVKITNNGIN